MRKIKVIKEMVDKKDGGATVVGAGRRITRFMGGGGEGNLLLPLICFQLRFGTYANLVPMVVPLVVGRSTSKWLGDKAVVKVRLHVKFVGHQPRPIVPVLLKRKGKERGVRERRKNTRFNIECDVIYM